MPEHSTRIVLGFDVGTAWIGVAVGQTITAQASPLNAIKSHQQKPDWVAIASLINIWQPEALIVGLPVRLDGSADEMTEICKKFSRQLQGRFHIATRLIDERLTTREAYNIAIESGGYKSKAEIDSISAVLITESWLRCNKQL